MQVARGTTIRFTGQRVEARIEAVERELRGKCKREGNELRVITACDLPLNVGVASTDPKAAPKLRPGFHYTFPFRKEDFRP